jgi:hypothetical protein
VGDCVAAEEGRNGKRLVVLEGKRRFVCYDWQESRDTHAMMVPYSTSTTHAYSRHSDAGPWGAAPFIASYYVPPVAPTANGWLLFGRILWQRVSQRTTVSSTLWGVSFAEHGRLAGDDDPIQSNPALSLVL